MGGYKLSHSKPSPINLDPGMVVAVALLTVAALAVIAATMLKVQKQSFPTIYAMEQAAMATDLSDLCFERGSQLLATLSKNGSLPPSTTAPYLTRTSSTALRDLISSSPADYWPQSHSPNIPLEVGGLSQSSQRLQYGNIGLVCSYEYMGPQYDRNTSGGVKGGEISVSRDYNASQNRERMFIIRAETAVPDRPPYAARVSVKYYVGVN